MSFSYIFQIPNEYFVYHAVDQLNATVCYILKLCII